MGTSGAYTGSGGKPGKDLRQGLAEWLDQFSGGEASSTPSAEPEKDTDDQTAAADRDQDSAQPDTTEPQSQTASNRLPAAVLLNVIALLRPRHSGGGHADGPGGGAVGGPAGAATRGRSGGGPQRTVAGFAGPAGRAAAAAYAYRTGDAPRLAELGLNYDTLRALNPLEVVRRIVDAACGLLRSTIEDTEERYVASGVADWVVLRTETPTPDDIARKAIALIIEEVALDETGDGVRHTDLAEAGQLTEEEIADIAEVIAERAELSVGGVTNAEFSRAIEDGIETLRRIRGRRP
jgi:hypothetical protein